MRILPKDELYRLHVEEFYTYQELAKHYRCSTETIRINMESHKIPKLNKGNCLARKMKMKKNELNAFLSQLYWDKKMSIHQIAEYLQVNQLTVWSYMNKQGIKRRPQK